MIFNYNINTSNKVFVCMLDASKAFDKVNVFTLFVRLCLVFIYEITDQYVQIANIKVNWN